MTVYFMLPFLCRTTHKFFDVKENSIQEATKSKVFYAYFPDYLTDGTMAWCDSVAYDIEMTENGSFL